MKFLGSPDSILSQWVDYISSVIFSREIQPHKNSFAAFCGKRSRRLIKEFYF